MGNKPKRKTRTSNAVKQRYNKKTYNRYSINLRIVEDAELIAKIEEEKSKGINTTEAFRKLIKTEVVKNMLIVSENSHPVRLVKLKIEKEIKENTKVFFITNEGSDEYVRHCETNQGECVSLSDIDNSYLESQYTILDITDDDRLQSDFSNKVYNALNCIYENIKSTPEKKAIYFNNIYTFFDSRYKTSKCISLIINILTHAKKYNCSVVIFNWKPIDFTMQYRDGDIDYTSNILSNIRTYIITSIQNDKNMKIISDIFRLTEREKQIIQSLKSNEGLSISNRSSNFIAWKK